MILICYNTSTARQLLLAAYHKPTQKLLTTQCTMLPYKLCKHYSESKREESDDLMCSSDALSD